MPLTQSSHITKTLNLSLIPLKIDKFAENSRMLHRYKYVDLWLKVMIEVSKCLGFETKTRKIKPVRRPRLPSQRDGCFPFA